MKKTISIITLATVLTFGATFANAGILVSDRNAPPTGCSASERDGIIIAGRDGIIIAGLTFISNTISEMIRGTQPCTTPASRDGIIIAG